MKQKLDIENQTKMPSEALGRSTRSFKNKLRTMRKIQTNLPVYNPADCRLNKDMHTVKDRKKNFRVLWNGSFRSDYSSDL